MPNFNVGDVVDLLDGGEVVAKGRVMNIDPSGIVHGQPMPIGHIFVAVIRVLNGNIPIPHVPPHEPEMITLHHVMGHIIAWLRSSLAIYPLLYI